MVGLPGTELDPGTETLIREYGIANFILFKRNVVDPLQVFRLCQDLKRTCREAGLPLPLISIDQEGGRVTRLIPPFTQFMAPSDMAASANPATELKRFGAITARELNLIGCNMNLTPVVDLAVPGADAVMKGRTLGSDPELVARLGNTVISGLQGKGILATAKHFPGIGRVQLDPHAELPVIDSPLAELRTRDLAPFQRAIEVHVAAIMTAHVIYPQLDAKVPATLSYDIITELLRHEMHFEGLVIADDMEMGAIEKHFGLEDAAVQAFMAGVDLVLFCHKHEKAVRAFEAIRNYVDRNQTAKTRLDEALLLIQAAKRKYGVLEAVDTAAEVDIKEYFKLC